MAKYKATGTQAICACKETAELAMDMMKDSEMEKNCAPDCEKMKIMLSEDQARIRDEIEAIKEPKSMEEWDGEFHERFKKYQDENPEKAQQYKEEGQKCKLCASKYMSEIEAKCGKMNPDDIVNKITNKCEILAA